MEPEGRLQSAALLSETCRTLLAEGIRKRHPTYNEEQVRLALIRCLLQEDLFLSKTSSCHFAFFVPLEPWILSLGR